MRYYDRMSITDNIMELKSGCRPFFREHPLTPSNNGSTTFMFSDAAGDIRTAQPITTLGSDSQSIVAVPLLLLLFPSPSSTLKNNLPFGISKRGATVPTSRDHTGASGPWSPRVVSTRTINQTLRPGVGREYQGHCRMFSPCP